MIPKESSLWSVLDVFRFYPSSLITCILWYDIAVHNLAIGKMSASEFFAEAQSNLEGIRDAAHASGMDDIASRADSIISRWIVKSDAIEDSKLLSVKTLVSELMGAIQNRLGDDLFFRIAQSQRPFYDKLLITPAGEAAFPSSVRDMREAGRCFALDQFTACVLHLMRALEFPLVAMTKALNFTSSSPNWEQVINECEREIAKINPNTHGINWREDQQFYSEAALHFRFLKNAWRNHAVHGHDTYDNREAREIMTHVRSFIDQLSQKLTE